MIIVERCRVASDTESIPQGLLELLLSHNL
jgi:hypothetical protein